MHKHCLLTALISVALSTCFLLPPRTTRIGEHHPQCAGPSNIKHQSGKHLRDLPMGHCDGGIFLTEAPSSQMISTLCQVDRKKNLTSALLSVNLLCPWLLRLLTWTTEASLPCPCFPTSGPSQISALTLLNLLLGSKCWTWEVLRLFFIKPSHTSFWPLEGYLTFLSGQMVRAVHVRFLQKMSPSAPCLWHV